MDDLLRVDAHHVKALCLNSLLGAVPFTPGCEPLLPRKHIAAKHHVLQDEVKAAAEDEADYDHIILKLTSTKISIGDLFAKSQSDQEEL